MNAGLLVFILLLLLSFLGIPIFISLGIGTLIALNMADLPMLVLPQKLFAGMNSSSLLAIPFFILAGNLMSRSITGKLIDVANALIGRIKGSLALVTVVASGLFGAISGSASAAAAAVGTMVQAGEAEPVSGRRLSETSLMGASVYRTFTPPLSYGPASPTTRAGSSSSRPAAVRRSSNEVLTSCRASTSTR